MFRSLDCSANRTNRSRVLESLVRNRLLSTHTRFNISILYDAGGGPTGAVSLMSIGSFPRWVYMVRSGVEVL